MGVHKLLKQLKQGVNLYKCTLFTPYSLMEIAAEMASLKDSVIKKKRVIWWASRQDRGRGGSCEE